MTGITGTLHEDEYMPLITSSLFLLRIKNISTTIVEKMIIIIIIDSLQKTAILGTSHIIRKVLQCEA